MASQKVDDSTTFLTGCNTCSDSSYTTPFILNVTHAATPLESTFFSTAKEEAYSTNTTGNLVQDGGFENQTSRTVSAPWSVEGDANAQGIDMDLGFAHTGTNNAWIRTSGSDWNAITQSIVVQPNTSYQLSGWAIYNFSNNLGYFGVRKSDGITVLQEASFRFAYEMSLNLQSIFTSGKDISEMGVILVQYSQRHALCYLCM